MERDRNQTMNRGVVLFAFNSDYCNYYDIAIRNAQRINYFLNLPVTVITNQQSISNSDYVFDNTIITDANSNNVLKNMTWLNKGRYKAYEFSPYDETLLLDVDYVVNSDKLLKTFHISDSICCHQTISIAGKPDVGPEFLGPYGFETYWATVVMFKKSIKTQQVFDCMKMIQENYEHYANIYGFVQLPYRNDYALTIAMRIANGHIIESTSKIPWNLLHIDEQHQIHKMKDESMNSRYILMYDNTQNGRTRKEYISINDCDFHMINKTNLAEII